MASLSTLDGTAAVSPFKKFKDETFLTQLFHFLYTNIASTSLHILPGYKFSRLGIVYNADLETHHIYRFSFLVWYSIWSLRRYVLAMVFGGQLSN